MATSNSVNDVSGWSDERLAATSPDLLRSMAKLQGVHTVGGRPQDEGAGTHLSYAEVDNAFRTLRRQRPREHHMIT